MRYFKKKKILIAGGTGLIGAALSNKLITLGAEVTSISIDDKKRINAVLDNQKIFKKVDLRNILLCKKYTKNKDIVINLMGYRESTQLGNNQSATALTSNILCNTNLVMSSCFNNVKNYLICGSINQYPPLPVRKEDDVWNGLPKAQDKFVGISKRLSEIQAEAYSVQYNWHAVKMVRLANVYGPCDNFNPDTAHVIPALINKSLSNKKQILEVAGDGTAIRDFIYVDDVVKGILLTLIRGKNNYPYNLGSGKGTSIKKLANVIKKFSNKNIKIKWNKNMPTGDKKRILNIDRAKKDLQFKTDFNIEKGIQNTIIWYKNNKMIANNFGRTYAKKYKL